MGTPVFAVPSLEALNNSGYNVALVVTQPDRPKGRGKKLTPPPVKTTAMALGLDVLQSETVKTDTFVEQIKKLAPDMFVVVAFGHILPQNLLDIPGRGAVNIHASLLPKYRGPAPIQWAVINGEKETGVTTMLLDTGMDTGDILMSQTEPILPDDTSASLHDRLAVLGGELLLKTLEGMEAGSVVPAPQDSTLATLAPMLKKKDGKIDWNMPAEKIDSFIRGMTPWPGAFTFHEDKRLKIFKAEPAEITAAAAPGTVIKGFQDELRVAADKGAVSILELQSASGKRLKIKDFLQGKSIPEGTVFS